MKNTQLRVCEKKNSRAGTLDATKAHGRLACRASGGPSGPLRRAPCHGNGIDHRWSNGAGRIATNESNGARTVYVPVYVCRLPMEEGSDGDGLAWALTHVTVRLDKPALTLTRHQSSLTHTWNNRLRLLASQTLMA